MKTVQKSRRWVALVKKAVVLGLAVGGLGAGCAEEAPFPYARYYDAPLRPVAVDPSPDVPYSIARNQPFEVTFDTYLDPEPLDSFSGLGLRSGGFRSGGLIRYRMVEKTLSLTVTREMEPALFYTLTFDDEVLRSVTGQAYGGPFAVEYLVGDYTRRVPVEPEAPVWSDVAPVFEACAVCHGDPEWLLPPMTYEGLVERASEQAEGEVLAIPFDAPRSYLMHKILWDYPIRAGEAQPPPWSGAEQLSVDDQILVERWIRGGAQR